MQIQNIHAFPDFEMGGKFSVTVTIGGFDTAQSALSAVLTALSTLNGEASAPATAKRSDALDYEAPLTIPNAMTPHPVGFKPSDEAIKALEASTPTPHPVAEAAQADEAPAPTATVTTLRPRRRNLETAAPAASENAAPAPDALTLVSRRPRREAKAEDAPPPAPTISDADLSRAASNAAEIIGADVVKEVLNDYHVKTLNELHVDVRQKFLDELQEEIRLAKLEAAQQAAG